MGGSKTEGPPHKPSVGHPRYRVRDLLDSVVHGAKGVFVGVARGDGCVLGVLFGEMSVVPLFHGGHGVVGGGERLFGADCGDPVVDRFFVSGAEIIEIQVSGSWRRGRCRNIAGAIESQEFHRAFMEEKE